MNSLEIETIPPLHQAASEGDTAKVKHFCRVKYLTVKTSLVVKFGINIARGTTDPESWQQHVLSLDSPRKILNSDITENGCSYNG